MASTLHYQDQENVPPNAAKNGKICVRRKDNGELINLDNHVRRDVLGLVNNKLNTHLFATKQGKVNKLTRKPLTTVVSLTEKCTNAGNILKNDTVKDEPVVLKLYTSLENSSIDESDTTNNPLLTDDVENLSSSFCLSEDNRDTIELAKIENQILVRISPDYQEEIRKHLFESEKRHRPHPLYMSRQPELTDQMRAILIDWLVSISDEYQMTSDTLHLAVGYIDRFLSKMSVVRSKLQLVGVTAMMIAAKYEEIYPPDVAEFVFLTSETYTMRQVIRMEQLILRILSFDLVSPTIQSFIDEYIIGCKDNELVYRMAMFLSELCLVESSSLLQFLPSKIAAGCVALARYHLNREDMWPESLESISGYSMRDLAPLVKKQQKIYEESPSKGLQAVCIKYRAKSCCEVSNIKPRILLLDD